MIAHFKPAFEWGNAAAAYCNPFAELCVESAHGAVFAETRSDNMDEAATIASIVALSKLPGPFRISIARYGRRGNPRLSSTQANAIRDGNVDLADRLMNMGIPTKLAGIVCGITSDALYSRARQLAMVRFRERAKIRRTNACQLQPNSLTGEQTEGAPEA